MIKTPLEIKDSVTGELIAGKIIGYNKYLVDGTEISIEVREDENGKNPREYYPDFKKERVYTKDGRPLTSALEDACENAEHSDEGLCIDCTGCRFYKKASDKTLFGVCMNDKNINL